MSFFSNSSGFITAVINGDNTETPSRLTPELINIRNIIPTSLRFCFPSKTFNTLFTKFFILLPFLL